MLNLRFGILLAALAFRTITDAFMPVQRPAPRYAVARQATIYYSPDEYCALDDCDDDGDVISSSALSNEDDPPLFLHSPTILGSLARLAVAFGPHKVPLNRIEHVQVTSFDTAHLDLQVVICEDECMTLLVPVAFPKPCQSTDEEECFMDNISQLDTQATAQIQQWEWNEHHHEEVSARGRDYDTLKTTDSYPEWWQKAGSLSRDCASLKRLLNEDDFHAEIKALVAYNLATDSQFDYFEVDQVAVADVGPAGIIIKASAYELSILDQTDDDDALVKPPKILQVPYAFPAPPQDMEGIQAAVLQAVAMAGDFMEG